jgi:hypothetical protein
VSRGHYHFGSTEKIIFQIPAKPEVLIINLVRKPCSWDADILDPPHFKTNRTKCGVQVINFFDNNTWIKFKNQLCCMDIPEWSKYGGNIGSGLIGVVKCIPPAAYKDDPIIYVNPEGFKYARYAGLAAN